MGIECKTCRNYFKPEDIIKDKGLPFLSLLGSNPLNRCRPCAKKAKKIRIASYIALPFIIFFSSGLVQMFLLGGFIVIELILLHKNLI